MSSSSENNVLKTTVTLSLCAEMYIVSCGRYCTHAGAPSIPAPPLFWISKYFLKTAAKQFRLNLETLLIVLSASPAVAATSMSSEAS